MKNFDILPGWFIKYLFIPRILVQACVNNSSMPCNSAQTGH